MKTNVRRAVLVGAVLVGVGLLMGCNYFNIFRFDRDPFRGSYIDASGQRILKDTPARWDLFREGVSRSVAREVAGKMPGGGGVRTWNEVWIENMRMIEFDTEHAPKYTDFIIVRRRLAGLPALSGYYQDAAGKIRMQDTPAWWAYSSLKVGYTIDKEVGGGMPNLEPTWNAFWTNHFRKIEFDENAPKYIQHIIERRRAAGLPELTGYPGVGVK